MIKLLGSDFYDINFEWWDGSLYIAQAINDDYNLDDTGSIKLNNFFIGTGSVTVQISTQFNDEYGTDAILATFTFQRGITGINNATTAEVIIGTDGNDKINGNGGFYDFIFAGSGNDTATGGSVPISSVVETTTMCSTARTATTFCAAISATTH